MAVDPLRLALAGGAPGPGGGPPPAMPGNASSEAKAIGFLQVAMKGLRMYIALEPDNEDKLVAQTCMTNLQKLMAKDQRDAAAAGGGGGRSAPAPAGPPQAGPGPA